MTDIIPGSLQSEVFAPVYFLLIFLAASFLMIWRLEAVKARGVEGTVLGTLVMPYCSGLGNLIFVFVLASGRGLSKEIVVNSLVNNVTNLTLLLGLPAIFWGMKVVGGKRPTKEHRINRLSLMLTMVAGLFFAGVVWVLARDGVMDLPDGLVLIGLFLFWQCFAVFDVLKTNIRKNRTFTPYLILDLILLAIGAWGLYVSIEWLTSWLLSVESGFISRKHLGWLSGWLMVLPNALLALYYGWKKRADVVYSSQVGDGHICIPLCIGLFACLRPVQIPEFFNLGIVLVAGATLVHLFFVGLFGRLPRFAGWLLVVAYGAYLYIGLS